MLNQAVPLAPNLYSPNALVPLVLYGWVPIVFLMFMFLPPRHAVIFAFLGAWMFLPMAGFSLPLIPDYTKMTATCVGVLLGAMIFDMPRVAVFRPKLWDLPMLFWCFAPLPASISNQLGVYDGLSESLLQVITWGLPYLIGRIYFSDMKSIRVLAIGIVAGGLVYVPFCLWESRMSPQLHHTLYGFHQHQFLQSIRLGGFRPIVFMQHGLMVATWMAAASLVAVWLWICGSVKRIWGVPMPLLIVVLLFTTVLCRSVGATILLISGLASLFMVRSLKSPIPVLCIIVSVPIYIAFRAPNIWTGRSLENLADTLTNPRAAQSLRWRFQNERILAAKAMQRPIFGWGGWGRSRVKDEFGHQAIHAADGLWIITFGRTGVVGLFLLMAMILSPVFLLLLRYPSAIWATPALGPSSALVMLLCLYIVDCLPNAMVNPIYMLASGGLIGTMTTQSRTVETTARRVARPPIRVGRTARP